MTDSDAENREGKDSSGPDPDPSPSDPGDGLPEGADGGGGGLDGSGGAADEGGAEESEDGNGDQLSDKAATHLAALIDAYVGSVEKNLLAKQPEEKKNGEQRPFIFFGVVLLFALLMAVGVLSDVGARWTLGASFNDQWIVLDVKTKGEPSDTLQRQPLTRSDDTVSPSDPEWQVTIDEEDQSALVVLPAGVSLLDITNFVGTDDSHVLLLPGARGSADTVRFPLIEAADESTLESPGVRAQNGSAVLLFPSSTILVTTDSISGAITVHGDTSLIRAPRDARPAFSARTISIVRTGEKRLRRRQNAITLGLVVFFLGLLLYAGYSLENPPREWTAASLFLMLGLFVILSAEVVEWLGDVDRTFDIVQIITGVLLGSAIGGVTYVLINVGSRWTLLRNEAFRSYSRSHADMKDLRDKARSAIQNAPKDKKGWYSPVEPAQVELARRIAKIDKVLVLVGALARNERAPDLVEAYAQVHLNQRILHVLMSMLLAVGFALVAIALGVDFVQPTDVLGNLRYAALLLGISFLVGMFPRVFITALKGFADRLADQKPGGKDADDALPMNPD